MAKAAHLRRGLIAGVSLLLALAVCVPSARGQNADYLVSWEGVRVGAALQMIGQAHPIGSLAARLAAPQNALTWPDWELTLTAPLPLKAEWVRELRDKTPLPDLTRRPFAELSQADQAYYMVFNQALVNAKLVQAKLFEEAGESDETRFVTYDHLLTQADLYRGKVVPVKGKLIRLRRWEAPRLARNEGVDFFWEGWVVGPTKDRNPYCIVFTELPAGLAEGEKLDQPIRFYGYFLKRFSYDAPQAKRFTHILVGPTVWLEKPPSPAVQSEGIFSQHVLIASAVGVLSITVVIVGLTLWFRRGDRNVQARLAHLRDRPLELGDEGPEPQPAEPRTGQAQNDFGPHGMRNSS